MILSRRATLPIMLNCKAKKKNCFLSKLYLKLVSKVILKRTRILVGALMVLFVFTTKAQIKELDENEV